MNQPAPPRLELVAVGLDHSTAAIDLRERVAFADGAIAPALAQLTDGADPLLEQAAILSTCNRVELYGAVRARRSQEELMSFLARYHGLEPHELTGRVYVHRGDEVAHHLAATSAGMHSLVIGEAQIQGQVRQALEHAVAAGTAGTELRRLFEAALSAGRQVRSRTALARGVASVPHASIDFVRQRLGTLSRSTVLLIGAGTTGELAAKHLSKHGVRDLLVLGRDRARAARLAERYGGRAVTSDQLGEALARADVVITSTGAPHVIVHRDELEAALADRGVNSQPLLLIDLAVPRDVDPAVAGLAGVEVYTIDDLRPVVAGTLAQRSAELPAAYSIVRAEVARFTRWLSRREATASLRPLSTEVEQARAAALETALEQLSSLSPDDREVLDAMTRGLARTLLERVGARLHMPPIGAPELITEPSALAG
ncbi:MAG TPA: glutamyl-tRNA reductase [Solirubrobacteraceae bacterium]|nr:glutamyl-tRNA reductase [Solirubrobacteraceae bacterium]